MARSDVAPLACSLAMTGAKSAALDAARSRSALIASLCASQSCRPYGGSGIAFARLPNRLQFAIWHI